MITLNGLELDHNLYLGGLDNTPKISYTQKRSAEGTSYVIAKSLGGGENLTLGSVRGTGGIIRGFWEKSQVDQIKTWEQQTLPVTLLYCNTSYTVLITGRDFTQFNVSEIEKPQKLYLGEIYLTEV